MYFVDVENIQKQLECFENHLKYAESLSVTNEIEKLAFERCLTVIIESFLDVCNGMIDGFIMRDPGSYIDIVDIMVDERVIPKNDEDSYKAFIELRKMVVQQYWNIDAQALFNSFHVCIETLQVFPHHVREYIEKELGEVVTAFKA